MEKFSKTCKDHANKAAVARWMMRKNDWGSIATISTIESMKGQPFSNIISFNEGLEGVSTGVPYFFITDMDQSMHDLKSHNFLSLSVSEYQEKIENISCYWTENKVKIHIFTYFHFVTC